MVAKKMEASVFIPNTFCVRMIMCSMSYHNPGAPCFLERNCPYILGKREA